MAQFISSPAAMVQAQFFRPYAVPTIIYEKLTTTFLIVNFLFDILMPNIPYTASAMKSQKRLCHTAILV